MTDRLPVSGEPRTEKCDAVLAYCALPMRHEGTHQYRTLPSEASTGAALDADDLRWRALIWLNHGHDGLYGDDGEMQCPHSPPTDFLRHSIDRIEAHLTHARLTEQEGEDR